MKWDFFISYANEDRIDIALPLAQELRKAGFQVWIDAFELKIGDNILTKINEGLSLSSFGIVILSESFFGGGRTSAELGGLFALEKPGTTRILPIWHNINEVTIAQHSPLLASRFAITTKASMFAVAQRIIRDTEGKLDTASTAHARLCKFLAHAQVSELTDFLAAHPFQLQFAAGLTGGRDFSAVAHSNPNPIVSIDPYLILSLIIQPTLLLEHITIIALGPRDLTDFENSWVTDARRSANDMHAILRAFISRKPKCTGKVILTIGRRQQLSGEQMFMFQGLSNQTSIRTYDWLLEAFLNAELHKLTRDQSR